MSKDTSAYIAEVSDKYKTGHAGEHAYRPTLEKFIRSIDEKLSVINDPKRTEYGAPDFIFVRGDIIAGYAETKDIDANLDKVEKSEQIERYLGYSNLILTNYLEFRFFRNGERYGKPIVIGKISNGVVNIKEESVVALEDSIADFLTAKPEAIKSGSHLAKIMGGKARRIRDNVREFLVVESDRNAELVRLYKTIKEVLVHDLTKESFADMYAQTLVYGLFAARYYDKTEKDFSRQEARDLIPKSNPLLQHFFDHIVGPDFDKRLEYIVNELCEVFSHANVQELMKQYFKTDLFGDTHEGPDPVIHFYEDFLKDYDPDLRKKLGAYYTPLSIVRFIVKSVDHLLKKEFGLSEGLADTSKTANDVHRVQVLDPAVGTGTFISAIIRVIYEKFLKNNQEGRWPAYVHHDLLPRLHGFEIMMTPYTIAHLKLGMAFGETGFWKFHRRLGIYLTNSLEESVTQKDLFSNFGFAKSITEEAKEAEKIKNQTPIMVVIGNPPYSSSSQNKGKWIQGLIKDYKKNLVEKKINLDDDYIKFIRFAEHFVEKNGVGIVAMITNNSFIDGVTHRQMRKHLLETFDSIYILDLHGSTKKRERAPDGGKDQNVFNIQQGVTILIFIRKSRDKKLLGSVYHADLYGERKVKFETLEQVSFDKVKWQKLDYGEPYYFFVPKDFSQKTEYEKGFSLPEIFIEYNSGIQTKRDKITIAYSKPEIESVASDFLTLNADELRSKYELPADGRDWKIELAKADVGKGYEISKILYRPFDLRWTIYTGRSKGFIAYPREKINRHILNNKNLALIACRNQSFKTAGFITDKISDLRTYSNPGSLGTDYVFPLYLYEENGLRVSNIKKEIIHRIENIVEEVSSEDIFDYIYSVLQSPSYSEKYKEFLKIDFPRVPYPKDAKSFKMLAKLGSELRTLHLFDSLQINQFVTTYPISGSNIVEKPIYKDNKVFINKNQYFGDLPESAWNFYIGGYQPAQKWLKDRKDRTLTNSDIEHYQKIIVILVETEKIMEKIDTIIRYVR